MRVPPRPVTMNECLMRCCPPPTRGLANTPVPAIVFPDFFRLRSPALFPPAYTRVSRVPLNEVISGLSRRLSSLSMLNFAPRFFRLALPRTINRRSADSLFTRITPRTALLMFDLAVFVVLFIADAAALSIAPLMPRSSRLTLASVALSKAIPNFTGTEAPTYRYRFRSRR